MEVISFLALIVVMIMILTNQSPDGTDGLKNWLGKRHSGGKEPVDTAPDHFESAHEPEHPTCLMGTGTFYLSQVNRGAAGDRIAVRFDLNDRRLEDGQPHYIVKSTKYDGAGDNFVTKPNKHRTESGDLADKTDSLGSTMFQVQQISLNRGKDMGVAIFTTHPLSDRRQNPIRVRDSEEAAKKYIQTEQVVIPLTGDKEGRSFYRTNAQKAAYRCIRGDVFWLGEQKFQVDRESPDMEIDDDEDDE